MITRLTTSDNQNFTFNAQLKLDFLATGADGELIWDPTDVILDIAAVLEADDGERGWHKRQRIHLDRPARRHVDAVLQNAELVLDEEGDPASRDLHERPRAHLRPVGHPHPNRTIRRLVSPDPQRTDALPLPSRKEPLPNAATARTPAKVQWPA